jgi:hypothetical protein
MRPQVRRYRLKQRIPVFPAGLLFFFGLAALRYLVRGVLLAPEPTLQIPGKFCGRAGDFFFQVIKLSPAHSVSDKARGLFFNTTQISPGTNY